MSKRVAFRVLHALVSTLTLASLAIAQEVMILDGSKLGNSPELPGGTYRIQVVKTQHSAEVLFYKGIDLWLRAPATFVEEAEKARHTEIDYQDAGEDNVITKIWLEGSKESFVFTPDSPPEVNISHISTKREHAN